MWVNKTRGKNPLQMLATVAGCDVQLWAPNATARAAATFRPHADTPVTVLRWNHKGSHGFVLAKKNMGFS
jgi:hypothetical protein